MADEQRKDDGFELDGEFFRLSVSDCGKDLMLIDRLTGMPITEFFEVVDDAFDRGRGPVLLTVIATSIRAAHPDWSVEKIVRKVMALRLSEIEFVPGTEEEDEDHPPVEGAIVPSTSLSNGSSPSLTLGASSPSETWSETPL